MVLFEKLKVKLNQNTKNGKALYIFWHYYRMNIFVISDQYNDESLVIRWFIRIIRRLYNVLVQYFSVIFVHYLSYITRISVKIIRFYYKCRLNNLDGCNKVIFKELISFYYRTLWIQIYVSLEWTAKTGSHRQFVCYKSDPYCIREHLPYLYLAEEANIPHFDKK